MSSKLLDRQRDHVQRSGRPYLLIVTIFAAFLSGCGARDKTVYVEANDPEMNAAIAQARATLPRFWQLFEHPEHGETDFVLKVKITDKNGTEHFWVVDVERKDGNISGTIDNDPDIVKSVKVGERIRVPEQDISDWGYVKSGKIFGKDTLRVLLKRLPPEEAKRIRTVLAENDRAA